MPVNDALQDLAESALGREQRGVYFEFSTSAKGQPAWRVRGMVLDEEISRPYALKVALGMEGRASVDPFAMLGKNATLRWEGEQTRFVHGIVAGVEETERTFDSTIIQVQIRPALTALEHTSSSRIFADSTIPDVVKQTLEEGLKPFGRKVSFIMTKASYAKREYVTQHRETDLAFIARLLAEEGLWYFFTHASEKEPEELVITDSPDHARPIAKDPEVTLGHKQSGTFHEVVTAFTHSSSMQTSAMHVRQFSWTHPELLVESHKKAESTRTFELSMYEHGDIACYDYQEPSYRKFDNDAQARLRLERHQTTSHAISGESGVTSLRPGHFLRVGGKEYLITHVRHRGNSVINTGQAGPRGEYENNFVCMPREEPHRPPRMPRPRMLGPQTAIVTDRAGSIKAPASSGDGDDIATDVHGRVRVKFHWDLTEAAKGGTNSCWLRVSQNLAGAGWGFQFIPRVGTEVIVQFIDGDPDQPVVTGCLYNGLNKPPYDKATQSGMKLASSVDRNRYNELRFEHAKDNEQIFVRAQKDYVEEVLNDHKTTVTGVQTQIVKKSQSESVYGNQSLSVGGKRTKTVGGDKECGEESTIKGERKLTVTKKNAEVCEDEHALTVTKAVKETYQDTHDRTVTGTQTFKADADKLEHVVGTYELTTDQAFVFNQGGTKLTYESEKVALDAASDVSVTCGPASATIDTSGKMELKTTGSITLQVGSNKVVLSQSGIEINGMQFSVAVGPSEIAMTPASSSITSVNVKVEATAICAINGSLLKLN